MEKVENFILVYSDGAIPEECAAFPDTAEGLQELVSYFEDNLEFNDPQTVRRIRGVRVEDPSGNYEYTVKEVKP